MSGAAAQATRLARVATDVETALRLQEILSELLDPERVAVAAFEGADGRWIVEVHFADGPDEASTCDAIAVAAGDEWARALTFETVAPRDWVATSLADLEPVEAGPFVIHGAHDRARVAASRIGIEIEAALAFGTGHHGTTQGCLAAIAAFAKRRKPAPARAGRRIAVLDVGTGTGVLAIAAARALRAPVLASDIDLQAVRVAGANVRLNRVGPLVSCVHARGIDSPRIRARAPFCLVLANILLSPLTRLARPLAGLLAPQARLVLSGLLRSQGAAALAVYAAQGLVLERRIPRDEWVTLVLRRPGSSR